MLNKEKYYDNLLSKTNEWKRNSEIEKELLSCLWLMGTYINWEKKWEDIVDNLRNHTYKIANWRINRSDRFSSCIDDLTILYLLIQYENKEKIVDMLW